jgi:hypothetical protein
MDESLKSNNAHQFKTLSEVEDYVYRVLNPHHMAVGKDVSLDDLMAVSDTSCLSGKIKQLIGFDDLGALSSSSGPQSVIHAKESLIKLFYKDSISESDLVLNTEERKKLVKKIEFSQSIKNNNKKGYGSDKELPFTHKNLDQMVLQGSIKEKPDFDIAEAKKLLKSVVSKKSR